MSAAETIESQFMRMGQRIIVEPADGDNFEAVVDHCLGWSLTHGVMNWQLRRTSNGEVFTYGIHVNAPVTVVSA